MAQSVLEPALFYVTTALILPELPTVQEGLDLTLCLWILTARLLFPYLIPAGRGFPAAISACA